MHMHIMLLNDRQETTEGNDATFASHFLGGSYLLSQLRLPQLKASASEQPRVVFVTPVAYAHYETSRLGDGHQYTGQAKYDGNFAYGYAKHGQESIVGGATFKGRLSKNG